MTAPPTPPPPPVPPARPPVHPPQPDADSGLRSSVAALLLGVVLAVGISKVVSLIGIGGDLASQAAGAASGAAPLLIDGMRRRRAINSLLPRVSLDHVRFGRPPLLVASVFGFALLMIDTLIGPYLGFMTRRILTQATGSTDGYVRALLWAVGLIQVPLVAVITVGLATAAAHRMTHHKVRWIWFGISIYVVVRIAMVVFGNIELEGVGTAAFVASAIFLGAVLGGLSMIGLLIATRTQAAFTAAAFFNHLSTDDQQAALALLANNDDDPHNDMSVEPMRPRFRPAPPAPVPPPTDTGGS